MKTLQAAFMSLALLLPLGAAASDAANASPPAASAASSMGLHGMVLFGGRDGLFASHMPMFHRPHDGQVLLQLRVADAKRDDELRQALARRPALWTLVPEHFELDRFAPDAPMPLNQFKADWVKGHFERGGKVRVANLQFVVEHVLLYQRLSDAPRQADHFDYVRIAASAQAHEQFWVKRITARPDADQILAWPLTHHDGPAFAPPAALSVASHGSVRTATPRELMEALRAQGVVLAHPPRELYLETGDLE